MEGIGEECGVFGVCSPKRYDIARTCYYGLYALQHRGQESCGIVVNDDGVLNGYKNLGLVGDVFDRASFDELGQGSLAIGHVRYSTTGSGERVNAQPILVNHIKGSMAVAHNGNIVNSYELRRELELEGAIFHTTSDTEVIAYHMIRERLRCDSLERAIERVMDRLQGSYSLVVVSPTKLICARDPQGFRPLCMGRTPDGKVIFASESCALDAVGASFERDIEPGEIVIADAGADASQRLRSIRSHCRMTSSHICIFEYIYFARPDSVIDGVSVEKAREKAGACLAARDLEEAGAVGDIVIGVPDSGLSAAASYSEYSGIPYKTGFVKNKYIGRTFISPGQSARESMVHIKLNIIREAVEGKRVILIDDSLVRGTTSREIVSRLRAAGAREIHLRFSAPPFLYPCYYGTDIPDREKLMAANHTMEEMRDILGCDSLKFLQVEQLAEIIGNRFRFCKGCFTGEYQGGVPQKKGKYSFERKHDFFRRK